MSLFEVKNITVAFGGVKALNDVSFGVEKGEIFTIIGPNGAGKSTLFNVISRIYEPSKGEIYFENQNISKTKPHNISKLGIARTFQNLELFENATVLQNLLLGRHIYKKTNISGATKIELKDLSHYSIGQLLYLWENKTIFNSIFWNTNAFDQWGVELGKINTKKQL